MKKSKAMDIRFHWIRDRIRQQHMQVIWQEGENNLADFFTKALPRHTHQARMKELMQIPIKYNNHFYLSTKIIILLIYYCKLITLTIDKVRYYN
jgi:hypothetical protein